MQYHHAEYDRVGDDGLLALEKNLAGACVEIKFRASYAIDATSSP